jgi:hypothetical protein
MVCYVPFASTVALRSCASLLAAAFLLVNGAPIASTSTPISTHHAKGNRGMQLVTFTVDQATLAVQPFGIKFIGAAAAHSTMRDAIAALARALRMHYFSFVTFDIEVFDFHALPANGRAHVIIPNRLVIFASPVAANRRPDGADTKQYADAMRLVPVLCDQRTRLLVRMCTCEYDTRVIARAIPDLSEINIFFPEECSPPLYAFAEMMEIIASPFHQNRGAIAVQSKHNMGRAPMFAALLLMQGACEFKI